MSGESGAEGLVSALKCKVDYMNRLENIAVRNVNIAEAWQEAGQECEGTKCKEWRCLRCRSHDLRGISPFL